MDTKIILMTELLIIILIIGIFYIFMTFSKKDKTQDCIGKWGNCNSDCTKNFNIVVPSKGNGKECEFIDNTAHWCEPGEGDCLKDNNEEKDCNILQHIPSNANVNTCPKSGVIKSRDSCYYKCNDGYKGIGNKNISCSDGKVLYDNNFVCKELHKESDDCHGYWTGCGYDCIKRYVIDKHRKNNGKECEYNHGDWAYCNNLETHGRCSSNIHNTYHDHHDHHNRHHYNDQHYRHHNNFRY